VPESVASFHPEVVFLDIGMPGISGYEVCRELRRAGHRGIRIVALTGYGQESDRSESEAAGFDEHLVKPVGIEVLQRALAAARE
jgi:CheY-like chemotaxis protein